MFVSILQRFGFKAPQRASEPLQSRADPNTRATESAGESGKSTTMRRDTVDAEHWQAADKPQNLAAKRAKPSQGSLASKPRLEPESYPQAASPRKKTVKAQAKKTQTSAKAKRPSAVKPSMKVKSAAPRAAVKPAAPKASVKVVKKVVKPARSVVPAVKAKPVVKAAPKKKAAPATRKKALEKAASAPLKAPAKPIQSVTKTVIKPALKPVAKAPAPQAAKSSKITKTPHPVSGPNVAPQPVAPVLAASPRSSAPLLAPKPLKPGRRSSARTAIQAPPSAPMVPTHAPDAAKASYAVMVERVIAPPIHATAKKDPRLANNWKNKPAEQLTDEEVKAMPDAEYMNETQLAFFRHKLSLLKQDIHNNAGETTEHLRADTVVVPDPADRATIEEEHALELRTRDRERKLLKKIEQSIARIDSGDYGYCDETGEAIGVGRLIARPTANLSLEAQQRRELKQKMFGD